MARRGRELHAATWVYPGAGTSLGDFLSTTTKEQKRRPPRLGMRRNQKAYGVVRSTYEVLGAVAPSDDDIGSWPRRSGGFEKGEAISIARPDWLRGETALWTSRRSRLKAWSAELRTWLFCARCFGWGLPNPEIGLSVPRVLGHLWSLGVLQSLR